jgi:hypothetical protein
MLPSGIRDGTLKRLYVFGLPTLGAALYFEADLLPFLQRAEAAGLNRREMHEDIVAVLARDKAKAFCIVKPLYSSLFHCVSSVSLCRCCAGLIGSYQTGIARSGGMAVGKPFEQTQVNYTPVLESIL